MAEDSEWVVESIAGFLGSPEWLIPLTDFIENKCSVFDEEEENKLSYTEIHQQYKQLVEKLLENYMQEVGISEQQFVDACSSPFAKSKTLQALFQPVLATNDFQMFRSLMVQKNVELQLQALRVIKERNGALPECLTDGTDVMSELEQQEMQILQEVLKRSKEEYEEEIARRELFAQKAGSTSTGLCEEPMRNGTAPQATAHTAAQPISIHNNCSTESKTLPAVRVPVKAPPPQMMSREKSGQHAAESWLEEARKEAGISKPFRELTVAQQEQLQQRAEYLRQQRDKLQALKKEQKGKSGGVEETPSPTPTPTPAPPTQASASKRLGGSASANGPQPQGTAATAQK
ncbi:hypothetical protein QTP86_022952, partial [Hemibagrus guttatus]